MWYGDPMMTLFIVDGLVEDSTGSLSTFSMPVEAEDRSSAVETATGLLVAAGGGRVLHVSLVRPALGRTVSLLARKTFSG